MNIIVLRNRGAARHVSVNGTIMAVAACTVLLLVLAGFAGGYLAARDPVGPRSLAELSRLRAEIAAQQASVEHLQSESREHLNALALRVGELNAGVIRLNALGKRLTRMAGLQDGEFDFDNPPAMGGAEEPVFTSVAGQLGDLVADLKSLDSNLYMQEQQLDVLEDLMLNRNLHKRVYPQGRPVRAGWMSSRFGRRSDPFTGKMAFHRGVDFAGKIGSDVIAVAAGVVTWAGDRYGYGKMIEINHGNGYVTRYAHQQKLLVAVGDNVQPGQVIGLMGSSGRSTGPHLHFEVWHLGRPVDPLRYIQQTS